MGFFNNFPYTNFHDLNLNWIMDKVREWGEKVAELADDVTDMKSMFHSLQDYVTHFFDSLVIKQAVAEKLEQMLRDGELDDILGLNIVRWGDLRQNELNGGRLCANETITMIIQVILFLCRMALCIVQMGIIPWRPR